MMENSANTWQHNQEAGEPGAARDLVDILSLSKGQA